MNHFMLKFNHGVEIGARLAYIGHFKRTGEAETRHEEYFRLGPVQYQNLQNLRQSIGSGRM